MKGFYAPNNSDSPKVSDANTQDLITTKKRLKMKKYSFTSMGLEAFIKLRPRAQQLLIDMVHLTGSECSLDAFYFRTDYESMGFSSYVIYHRYMKELKDHKFLLKTNKGLLIDFNMIDYMTSRQWQWLSQGYDDKPEKAIEEPSADYSLRVVGE